MSHRSRKTNRQSFLQQQSYEQTEEAHKKAPKKRKKSGVKTRSIKGIEVGMMRGFSGKRHEGQELKTRTRNKNEKQAPD